MTNEELIVFRKKILKQSQAQLADIIGVSTGAVVLWEKGERKVPKPVSKLLKVIGTYPSLVGQIRSF